MVDFRSQPNTLGGQAVPAASRTPPRPHLNCLPFLGHEKWEAFYASRLEGETRHRGQEGGDRVLRARPRLQVGGEGAIGPARHRETMALRIPVVRKRGAAIHGRQAGQVHIRAEGRRRLRRRRRRHDEGRGDDGVRHNVDVAAQEMVRALPRGRRGGPAPEAQGPAERFQDEAADPRGGARGALPKARDRGGLPKKIACPGREGRALDWLH